MVVVMFLLRVLGMIGLAIFKESLDKLWVQSYDLFQ